MVESVTVVSCVNRRSVHVIKSAGFTYIGVLLAVALMGAMLVSIATVYHQAQQREHELQLLFIGDQFRSAIGSYYNAPGLTPQFPKSMVDLIEDRRAPEIRRHLRKIFHDPFSGSTDWGIIKAADGGITGIFSKSGDKPLKQANFNVKDAGLSDKAHYYEWRFEYGVASAQANFAQVTPTTTVPVQPPEIVPPEYQPPPPVANDRFKRLCELTRTADMQSCLNVAKKFGNAAGTRCLLSASARFETCINKQPMPILDVQYE